MLSDTEVLVRGDATVSFCLNLKDGADYITVNHARGLVFDAGASTPRFFPCGEINCVDGGGDGGRGVDEL